MVCYEYRSEGRGLLTMSQNPNLKKRVTDEFDKD